MFEIYPEINRIVATFLILGGAFAFAVAGLMTIYRLEKDEHHKHKKPHKLKKA